MPQSFLFILSKIGWFLFVPSHFFVFLLLLSFLVVLPWWLRAVLRGLSALFFVLMLFVPLGYWALVPLEQCYVESTPPMQLDGVLVLGGALDEAVTQGRQFPVLNANSDRVVALLKVLQQNKTLPVVYAGGVYANTIFSTGQPLFGEGEKIKDWLKAVGVDATMLTSENASRNTYENALNTEAFFGKAPGQNWLLITSAYHMPRAMALFSKIGAAHGTHFHPQNADYRTTGTFTMDAQHTLPANLQNLDIAAKEYVGLWLNQQLGHSDTAWPCQAGTADKQP